jgi:hypothetical protein
MDKTCCFEESLRAVMCDTNIGSIQTWGYVLEVPSQTIQDWIDGNSRPKPEEIELIIFNIEKTVAGSSPELANFKEVLSGLNNLPPQ